MYHFPDRAKSLIEREGVGGLGGFDGCDCMSFSIFGIDVEVSCRKSGGSKGAPSGVSVVKIYPRSMDYSQEEGREIGLQVASQLSANRVIVIVRADDGSWPEISDLPVLDKTQHKEPSG